MPCAPLWVGCPRTRTPPTRAASRPCPPACATGVSRALVVDEGHQNFGVTAEIAARIAEKAFYHLDAPVERMGAMDVPVPFSPALEDLTVPTPQAVAAKAAALVRGEVNHGA